MKAVELEMATKLTDVAKMVAEYVPGGRPTMKLFAIKVSPPCGTIVDVL